MAFSVAGIIALFALVWLLAFGTTAPCEALAGQVSHLIAGQPKAVADATNAEVAKLSTVECAGIALRLRAGDTSAVRVVIQR
jgi:hypothetical protein